MFYLTLFKHIYWSHCMWFHQFVHAEKLDVYGEVFRFLSKWNIIFFSLWSPDFKILFSLWMYPEFCSLAVHCSRMHNNFQFCVNCLPHDCTFSPSRLVYQSMNLHLMPPTVAVANPFYFSRLYLLFLPYAPPPPYLIFDLPTNEDQRMIVIHYCFSYEFCCIHNGPFIRCLFFITYPNILNRAKFYNNVHLTLTFSNAIF